MSFSKGQGQHEDIRSNMPFRKQKHARKGYWEHKNVDSQEVKREKPGSFSNMFFIDIFHYQDLELSGQKHDCHHGEKGKGEPVCIASWQDIKLHKLCSFLIAACPVEEINRTVKHGKGNKDACSTESQ